MTKSVLYARVSSKEQEQEGFFIPSQEKLLRNYAQERGISIVKEFVDVETANLSLRQLDFLNLLKEHILDKETVKKRDLIESPFTVLHPQGIRGLFSSREISEIIELTERLAA